MAQDDSVKEKKTSILVTGANKGIGLEFAKICLNDHDNIALIIGCRSLGRVVSYDANLSKEKLNKTPDYWECLGDDGKVNAKWNDGKHTRKDILSAKFDAIMKNGDNKDKNNSIDFVELDINTGKNSKNNDEKIDEAYGNARKTVDASVKYLKDTYGTIDILVNNAGFASKGPAFDVDIVTRTSSINYYGTKYLTELYLGNQLMTLNSGKIIFVSSMAGRYGFRGSNKDVKDEFARIVEKGDKSELDNFMEIFASAVAKNKDDVKHETFEFAKSAYGMSKAGLSMYSRLVARDSVKDKVALGVAAYCPGYCQSYLSSGGGKRTSKDGARGIELLCFSQELADATNGQFWQMEITKGVHKLAHQTWKGYMM